MASITVVVHQITVTYNAPYAAAGYEVGNYVHCILDDVALTISVQIRNSPSIGGGSLVSSPVTGPNTFFGDGGSMTASFSGTPTPQPYWSRCDSTTLQRVVILNTFPHATVGSTPGASQCVVTPVCDLTISDSYSVTPASGPSASDGEVTVSATSSNGTIKYSLTSGFDYATQGQTSPTFSGYIAGSYTIYAKDPIGCTDQIDVTIPISIEYGLKYYFEYTAVKNVRYRLEIEERAFTDPETELQCIGTPPVILRTSGGQDKYHPVWYGNAEMTLLTETDLQWQELFTSDSRKYKFKLYYEDSGWNLCYVGFLVPTLYSEPYLNPKFPTSITITDGIGNLKNLPLLDDDGNELFEVNSKIFVIAMILRKTGLDLSIRSCIDLLDAGMDSTDDDDVLEQAYVDCRIFYGDEPDDCETVLTKLLQPYGAYLKSAFGYYWIIRQEKSIGDLPYRQFDKDGVFESSGTFESLRGIYFPANVTTTDQFNWRDVAQLRQFQKKYGKFQIVHDLLPDNNLIDSGSFELDYVTEVSGQQGFLDWNVFLAQAGLRYGYEAVKNGDSKGAFFFDFVSVGADQADNILYSKMIRVRDSVFDFSFQYYIEPEFSNFPFVRIAYQVKATPVSGGTTFYYSPFGVWDSVVLKNELFVTSYNSWNKFERRFPDFPVVDPVGYDVEISFYAHNHFGADASDTDFGEMKAISTTGQFTPGKRIYYNDQTDSLLRAYTLRETNETESLPDRVQPDDYNGTTNKKVWFLDQSISTGANQSFVRKTMFDNVIFNQLVLILTPVTYYSDAPNPATYELITDVTNVQTLRLPIALGDVYQDDSGGIQSQVPNPNIYRSWIRLADGTPTQNWYRRGITEEGLLLDYLLQDLAAQFRDSTQKLEGVLMGTGFLSPVHSIEDFNVDNKKYIILSYENDTKANAIRVRLDEVVTGADGLPPPEDSAFSLGFSIGFKA